MEELQKAYRSAISHDSNRSSVTSSIDKVNSSLKASTHSSALSADQSQLLVARSSGPVVSLWNCSKLCAFCFIAGMFVGYTLKRRVRRWATRLFRRIKDN